MPTMQAPNKQLERSTLSFDQLSLLSQAFRDNCPIPRQYTNRGEGVSPPLTIMNVPDDAKSLVLIMHDPDAVNGDFTHWLVWDMPASTDIIAANTVPIGAIQGTNDAGQRKYTAPSPPAGTGTHRYIFELYALNRSLGLPPETNRHQLEQSMEDYVLEKTVLTGLLDAPSN